MDAPRASSGQDNAEAEKATKRKAASEEGAGLELSDELPNLQTGYDVLL
jgi:hypothetical protein